MDRELAGDEVPEGGLAASRSLALYLEEVERGLRGLPAARRNHFIRELRCHLLDEADARGVLSEEDLEGMLAAKESPDQLARGLGQGEDVNASHRGESALAAGSLIGLATGTLLVVQGFPWFLALSFGVVHGLAVGSGLLWLRPRWQWVAAPGRLLLAVGMGAILAIPLGFTRFLATQDFIWSRLFYGAFTGYLVERHSQRRPAWQIPLEVLLFTAVMFAVDFLLLHRLRRFSLPMMERELVFNTTITAAVLGALWLKRFLAGHWVLGRSGARD